MGIDFLLLHLHLDERFFEKCGLAIWLVTRLVNNIQGRYRLEPGLKKMSRLFDYQKLGLYLNRELSISCHADSCEMNIMKRSYSSVSGGMVFVQFAFS